MMSEERFASRVRQALNQTLDDVPPTALRRLEAARHHALSRQKQAEPVLVLANTGGSASHGNGSSVHHRGRTLLAALALLAGMAIAAYWQAEDYIAGLVDVDSALLTDELPPEAFLDQGFSTWLLDDSSEE